MTHNSYNNHQSRSSSRYRDVSPPRSRHEEPRYQGKVPERVVSPLGSSRFEKPSKWSPAYFDQKHHRSAYESETCRGYTPPGFNYYYGREMKRRESEREERPRTSETFGPSSSGLSRSKAVRHKEKPVNLREKVLRCAETSKVETRREMPRAHTFSNFSKGGYSDWERY
ncbi:hypothetical protein K491DRAFT_676571 [Lophiostoma macrostomum CBS 122681]|uniref:Uncharacterized protein n=1 Tax=Lophiostoma macrostomum CBS 122681 TaxID=1314788 RepID=A0A6A6THD2_9PLEO|nr:hypothetical protein K491DRAFT_676571 [Lophiostoma macrostomum CBS 122681]